jgi:hypothetical protein
LRMATSRESNTWFIIAFANTPLRISLTSLSGVTLSL